MKIELKIGDKVTVLNGKFAGKEASILFIDKKTKRVRLDGLKKQTIKTKKGSAKELHGTFGMANVKAKQVEKKEEPKQEAAAPTPAAS